MKSVLKVLGAGAAGTEQGRPSKAGMEVQESGRRRFHLMTRPEPLIRTLDLYATDRQAQRPEEEASQSGGTGDYLHKINTSLSADEGAICMGFEGLLAVPGAWQCRRGGVGGAETGVPTWEQDRSTWTQLLHHAGKMATVSRPGPV